MLDFVRVVEAAETRMQRKRLSDEPAVEGALLDRATAVEDHAEPAVEGALLDGDNALEDYAKEEDEDMLEVQRMLEQDEENDAQQQPSHVAPWEPVDSELQQRLQGGGGGGLMFRSP